MICGSSHSAAANSMAHIIVVVTLSFGCAQVLSAQAAQDSEYCAFQVFVRSPTGQPLSGVSVSAAWRRDNSPFATVKTDADGIARICDGPIGTRIDIHVGNGPCGAVTIGDLSVVAKDPASPRYLRALRPS